MKSTPTEPPTELRIKLLNAELEFLEKEWGGLGHLNHLIRELGDQALDPPSRSALATCPPSLDGGDLVLTSDLPARQFVAHLLELRPSLIRRWPRGEPPPTDPPYDARPIATVIRKIRGRERRTDLPNVPGFYRVFYRHPDSSEGYITSFGVIEVGPPPHGAIQFRCEEGWRSISDLGLADAAFDGPYRSEKEADDSSTSRP